jgi:hypothetical protein
VQKVCNDNNLCTVDKCDAGVGCKYVDKFCDDSNSCTTDSCQGGKCIYTAATEGAPCSTNSVCKSGTCTKLKVGVAYSRYPVDISSTCPESKDFPTSYANATTLGTQLKSIPNLEVTLEKWESAGPNNCGLPSGYDIVILVGAQYSWGGCVDCKPSGCKAGYHSAFYDAGFSDVNASFSTFCQKKSPCSGVATAFMLGDFDGSKMAKLIQNFVGKAKSGLPSVSCSDVTKGL